VIFLEEFQILGLQKESIDLKFEGCKSKSEKEKNKH
jgi:hypothetical protein